MTWEYKISDDIQVMKVYDSNGNLVEEMQNDGSGFEIPTDITRLMRREAEKARENNNTERWRDIHIRLADDDIERRDQT